MCLNKGRGEVGAHDKGRVLLAPALCEERARGARWGERSEAGEKERGRERGREGEWIGGMEGGREEETHTEREEKGKRWEMG